MTSSSVKRFLNLLSDASISHTATTKSATKYIAYQAEGSSQSDLNSAVISVLVIATSKPRGVD